MSTLARAVEEAGTLVVFRTKLAAVACAAALIVVGCSSDDPSATSAKVDHRASTGEAALLEPADLRADLIEGEHWILSTSGPFFGDRSEWDEVLDERDADDIGRANVLMQFGDGPFMECFTERPPAAVSYGETTLHHADNADTVGDANAAFEFVFQRLWVYQTPAEAAAAWRFHRNPGLYVAEGADVTITVEEPDGSRSRSCAPREVADEGERCDLGSGCSLFGPTSPDLSQEWMYVTDGRIVIEVGMEWNGTLQAPYDIHEVARTALEKAGRSELTSTDVESDPVVDTPVGSVSDMSTPSDTAGFEVTDRPINGAEN